jgi:arginine N-succinyltransferase
MNFVRPIRLSDLPALLHIAETAGAGFTSLPPVAEILQKKIELSVESFAKAISEVGHERYMFVLEDSVTRRIGGCCAIEAACGLDEPFYNYHVGCTVHATREHSVYNRFPTLYLSNDYTGTSVLCSLYLMPEFRSGGAGRLLSKCRFLFMADFAHRFSAKVIAEMRGVSDELGRSPFWEGLGRHFFSVDYSRAEHIVGMGDKAFIAQLMPKHPIYAVLLPPEARDVIGRVHPQTTPALRLLEQEGFRYQNYIDIFDGGPTVEAPLAEIRSIRHSRLLTARIDDSASAVGGSDSLLANMRVDAFRCALARLESSGDSVTINSELASVLELTSGELVRLATLN